MLIANDSFAHWRYKTAHRTTAIGRGKCLQRRLLDHEPLGGHLIGRRVHARVRDLAKPPRNCSIRRVLVGFQASRSHRRNKRNPEAALQIADEAFYLAFRLRAIWLTQSRQESCVPRIIEESRMEAMHAKPISVPLDNDSFHVVVEDLDRHAPKGEERGLVTADQRLDPLVVAELDIGLAAPPKRRNEER